MKSLYLFWVGIIFILAVGCHSTNKPMDSSLSTDTIKTTKIADTVADKEMLKTIATEILTTLKAKDYTALVAYFHPTEKILFSPYGFIDIKTAKKLTKTAFMQLVKDKRNINWGNYDGSGEPIDLTIAQYIDKFVYNVDFLHAEKTAYNQIIGKGNSLNNLNEIFPKYPFIEYYFSGFDEKYAGMDWASLRLVFKLYQGNYYLVAIVHDQWTT
jgi:hypothetical protein